MRPPQLPPLCCRQLLCARRSSFKRRIKRMARNSKTQVFLMQTSGALSANACQLSSNNRRAHVIKHIPMYCLYTAASGHRAAPRHQHHTAHKASENSNNKGSVLSTPPMAAVLLADLKFQRKRWRTACAMAGQLPFLVSHERGLPMLLASLAAAVESTRFCSIPAKVVSLSAHLFGCRGSCAIWRCTLFGSWLCADRPHASHHKKYVAGDIQ